MSSKSDDWNGWKPLLTDLEERKRQARAMGGAERLERLVYARGKLDARQRLAHLFDPDSFSEIGPLVGGSKIPADALVTGSGRIEGRMVLAGAEDFSVLGGSIGRGASSLSEQGRVEHEEPSGARRRRRVRVCLCVSPSFIILRSILNRS